jgi:hypothetical protein
LPGDTRDLWTSSIPLWQAFGPLTNELEGGVLEITGITDTDRGYGG